MIVSQANVFSIQNEILSQQKQQEQTNASKEKQITFSELKQLVKDHFDNWFEESGTDNSSSINRLELVHQALVGDVEAERFLVSEIESFLREHHFLNVSYPDYYEGLGHAIFHENFRFGVLYKWYQMSDSPAAVFINDEFWIERNDKFELQEERLEDHKVIDDYIRRFQASHDWLKINRSNPKEEIALNDGTRVTIIVPPASQYPTLVFRKYIVSNVSFEEQAKEYGTIAEEDIHFFQVASRLMFNTVVAGHIKSGKSTMLKTFYGARPSSKVAVLIEKTAETFLKKDFPNRLVHELYSAGQEINDVIATALRLDHDYVIVQEVRGVEAEGAIAGTQRGRRGLLMTYHITNPQRTPEQLATHIVDEYPNRRQASEVRRVAESLDLGVIMESKEGQKRVTALYEIGYNEEKDYAFINYLMKYDDAHHCWMYNPNVSGTFRKRMEEENQDLAQQFLKHLEKRSKQFPMKEETYRYIPIERE